MAGNVETTNADVLPDGKGRDAPSEAVAMSGTLFRTTDPTREWSGRNTSPSVDPGAGNPVSKPEFVMKL